MKKQSRQGRLTHDTSHLFIDEDNKNMNNLPLKPLRWDSQNHARSAFHEYLIRKDGEARKNSKSQYEVVYGRLNTQQSYDVATGFATIDDAKQWAWNHYNEKMQPYIVPTTLADAVQILVDACHGASVKGGWWHDLATGEPLQRNKLEMIALIHSEVSEAVEGVRKGINDDHLPKYPMEDVEMADALIRIFDYIGGHNLQTADALADKLAYNANRSDHKPENRAKAGGKKY